MLMCDVDAGRTEPCKILCTSLFPGSIRVSVIHSKLASGVMCVAMCVHFSSGKIGKNSCRVVGQISHKSKQQCLYENKL